MGQFMELSFYIQKTNFIKQLKITSYMKMIVHPADINKIVLVIWFLIFFLITSLKLKN